MLLFLLHLSTISVRIIDFDGAKKENRLEKCIYHHSEWNLASNFLMAAWLK